MENEMGIKPSKMLEKEIRQRAPGLSAENPILHLSDGFYLSLAKEVKGYSFLTEISEENRILYLQQKIEPVF